MRQSLLLPFPLPLFTGGYYAFDQVLQWRRGVESQHRGGLRRQPLLVRGAAALLKAGRVIGLCPTEEGGAGGGHVARSAEALAIALDLPAPQSLHARRRVERE